MADFNPNVIRKTKELVLHLRENEAKYIAGELDLNSTLKETDVLFNEAASVETSACGVLQDSGLIQLQSRIAKECVKAYQVDTLVFEPRIFCEKIKNLFSPDDESNNNREINSSRRNSFPRVWEKLGEYCKNVENTVPPFSFIYGTFDADSIELPVKERKQRVTDKLCDKTRPEEVTVGSQKEEDIMLKDVNRMYAIFSKLISKSEKQALCFFEFVTDPDSFTRTVENIFLVSFLVKEGYVCIFADEEGLPCMRKVSPSERKSFDNKELMQSVLSIDQNDWKNIVKTFNFKNPLIPRRKNETEVGTSK